MTRDRYKIGDVTDSVVAVGPKSVASRHVVMGSELDVPSARAELTALISELRARDDAAASLARRHAENLDEALDDAEPAAVERSWSKLAVAMGGLTVAANLAQIGQLVQALVHG